MTTKEASRTVYAKQRVLVGQLMKALGKMTAADAARILANDSTME
jgi:hypothetical protein